MINVNEKLAGLLVPVFALRRNGDLGIGDTKSVKEAVDFCARNHIGVLQVLPINETGGDNSPYNAISSVALDPVLLETSPDAVPGLTQKTFTSIAHPQLIEELDQASIDYRRVKCLKFDLLKAAFENFQKTKEAAGSAAAKEFSTFCGLEKDWLGDYTLFRTIMSRKHGDACWTRWEEPLRTLESARKTVSTGSDKTEFEQTQQFFAWVQWVAYKQWKAVRAYADTKGVRLMGDIPFGISRYSADVFASQDLFDLEWSGGAPPETWFQDDLFTMKWGQNWGLPLYRWDKHEAQGFSWWTQRVRKCTEIFHYFRIDHVLGFFRMYSFPWVPERNHEFLELTEQEAAEITGGKLPKFIARGDETKEDRAANAKQGRALLQMILDAAQDEGVVAEDLGLVPIYVRPLLQEMGIPGFSIPIWERDDEGELTPKDELPALSLATYATHDHQPMVLYYEDLVRRWHGPDGHEAWLDVQRLMRFLDLPADDPPKEFTSELHAAFIRTLLETRCWLAVFMITDLLGTSERFNQPGMSSDSNWSRRLDYPLSYFEKNPPYQAVLDEFSRQVQKTKRLPQSLKVGTIR